jgi:hypothetical protein
MLSGESPILGALSKTRKKPKKKTINESVFPKSCLLTKRTGDLFNENKQAFAFPVNNVSLRYKGGRGPLFCEI